MEFAEVLRRRRMVRRYELGQGVDEAVLDRVLAAASRAPSAGFTQAVELLVLADADDRDRFWRTQVDHQALTQPSAWLAGLRTAPVLVVVTTSERAYEDRYAEADKASGGGPGRTWTAPFADVDAGMAVMAVLLAAVDEGLGACFFGLAGAPATGRLTDEFGIPAERRCVGVVSLGHPEPAAARSGSPTRRPRRPVSQTIHRGSW